MKHLKTIVTLAVLVSSLPLLAQDTSTSAAAQIPEEARKHFVMGTALFKDAKTPDDYTQVVCEFKQAADLAPQWPDARYNLALAKEAAGDYSGAMADLKLYQQFKLSDDEARTVQDKIYVLEAKQQKKASADSAKQAEEQKTTAESARKMEEYSSMVGTWGYTDPECSNCSEQVLVIAKTLIGVYTVDYLNSAHHAGVNISGNKTHLKFELNFGGPANELYDLTLSEDGTKMTMVHQIFDTRRGWSSGSREFIRK